MSTLVQENTKSIVAKASAKANSVLNNGYKSQFSPTKPAVSIAPTQPAGNIQTFEGKTEYKPDILEPRTFDITTPEYYEEFIKDDPEIMEPKLNSDHMYYLLSSPVAEKSLDKLAKDPAMPILCFTGYLYRQIRYITKKIPNSEYAIFLMLRRIDPNRPHFLAFDFFMPGQVASSAGVSLYPNECDRYFDMMRNIPYYKENGLHRYICHLHSHASFQTFWSGTDDEQQLSRNDLGFMDDYRFYVVVNAAGDIKCSLVTYKPALVRVDATVAISCADATYSKWLDKSRKSEIDRMISSYIIRNTPVTYSYGSTGSTWSYGSWIGNSTTNTKSDDKMHITDEYTDFYGNLYNNATVKKESSTSNSTTYSSVLQDWSDFVAGSAEESIKTVNGVLNLDYIVSAVESSLPQYLSINKEYITNITGWFVSIISRAYSTYGIVPTEEDFEMNSEFIGSYIREITDVVVNPDIRSYQEEVNSYVSEHILDALTSGSTLGMVLDGIEEEVFDEITLSIEDDNLIENRK